MDFQQRDVAPELVRLILEAGLAAPTAYYFQPQRIKPVDDDSSRVADLGCLAPLIVGHKSPEAHPRKGHLTS